MDVMPVMLTYPEWFCFISSLLCLPFFEFFVYWHLIEQHLLQALLLDMVLLE